MSSQFDRCFKYVVGEEGGFTNDPRDNGGATKFGVTIKTLKDWRKKDVTVEDVKSLTIEEAKEIYDALYWRVIQGDAFPFDAALLLFDTAINSGAVQAVIWLQRALGVNADGKCGPLTIAAYKASSRSKFNPPETILAKFVSYRLLLMAKHEDFDRFGSGWFRRVAETCIRAGSGNIGE